MLFELVYLFLAVILLPCLLFSICYNISYWALRRVIIILDTVVWFIHQIAPEVQFWQIHGEGVDIPIDV